MVRSVAEYLKDGCGRCSLFGTDQCKARSWHEVLEAAREILTSTELHEESKWGVPCYTYQGKNVVLLSAFKDYVAVSFYQGALLADPHHILQRPGPN